MNRIELHLGTFPLSTIDMFLSFFNGHKDAHLEVRGMSHCWCGNAMIRHWSDTMTIKKGTWGHTLMSVCHPVNQLLNREHETEDAIPSCVFTPQFIDLILSRLHCCDKG